MGVYFLLDFGSTDRATARQPHPTSPKGRRKDTTCTTELKMERNGSMSLTPVYSIGLTPKYLLALTSKYLDCKMYLFVKSIGG